MPVILESVSYRQFHDSNAYWITSTSCSQTNLICVGWKGIFIIANVGLNRLGKLKIEGFTIKKKYQNIRIFKSPPSNKIRWKKKSEKKLSVHAIKVDTETNIVRLKFRTSMIIWKLKLAHCPNYFFGKAIRANGRLRSSCTVSLTSNKTAF